MEDLQFQETVVVTIDIPAEGILAGDIGTIVDIYNQGVTAYEVEFATADGTTRALITLPPNHIRRLTQTDVLTTRQQPAIFPPETDYT